MQGRVSLYAGDLGQCVCGEVDVVVCQVTVRVGVEETEEACICASTERDDLLGRRRTGEEELCDKKVDCRGADVGAWVVVSSAVYTMLTSADIPLLSSGSLLVEGCVAKSFAYGSCR